MKSLAFFLLDVHLMVFLNHPYSARATKIIDYDNVVENPYYRKSNLELLIRKQCNFLQVKTTTLLPPTLAPGELSTGKLSSRLKSAFEMMGLAVNSNSELTNRVVDGLVNFIRTVHPNHPLCQRNLTAEERTRLTKMLPVLIEQMENDPEYNDDPDDLLL